MLATTRWVKTGIQVAQNDREAKAHHHEQVSLHFRPSSPSMADLVSKNGRFCAFFRTIVLKTPDDRSCVPRALAMRAVVLPWRLGYQMMANGCSINHVPCRGVTRWSNLR